jgi:hypothetical protein
MDFMTDFTKDFTTEQINQWILNRVSQPVLNAALAINHGERFHELFSRFPRIESKVAKDEHYVSLERQIEIMDEVSRAAGMPVKYHKIEGGFWDLDKKYPRNDILLTIIARQWVDVRFFVVPNKNYMLAGGPLGLIYNAIRVSQGEVLDYETGWRVPPSVWCFSEEDFYQATQESFALLVEMQAHITEGCTEGFRAKTVKATKS